MSAAGVLAGLADAASVDEPILSDSLVAGDGAAD